MTTIIQIFLLISTLYGASLACNKQHGGGYEHGGWGQPQPLILLPKPTLLPKLKQAYLAGKHGVDYHKIVGPSLKPLPYKKGVGFVGLGNHGWGGGINNIGHFGDYGYHQGISKSGYVGVKGNIGWGKGRKHIGGHIGGHVGGHVGAFGPVGPVGPIGLGGPAPFIGGGISGPYGHGNYIPVTPISPIVNKLPVPFIHHHGHSGHHGVSHQSVTVVRKGFPPQQVYPLDPHNFHGKK